MIHRPRPGRVLVLSLLTIASAALLYFRVEPQLLFLAATPGLAGLTVYELIPGASA